VFPKGERAEVLRRSLETYHISHDNLTRQQRYDLMTLVLTQRAHRLRMIAQTSIALTTIIAVATVVVLVVAPSRAATKEKSVDPIWSRNWELLAAARQPFLEITNTNFSPPRSHRIVLKKEFTDRLRALELSSDPSLQASVSELATLITTGASDGVSPNQIIVTDKMAEQYASIKKSVRKHAADAGIDVVGVERTYNPEIPKVDF